MNSALTKLHEAFHRPPSALYQLVDRAIWGLILLSAGLLLVEPVVSGPGLRAVRALDRVLLGVFVVELVLRVVSVQPRELDVFQRSRWGRMRVHVTSRVWFLLRPLVLVDLLTVMALVPALRGLRALRLLRLLRSGRFFRYRNPFDGFVRAFEADRMLFLFAFTVLGVETLLGGVSIFLVERGQGTQISSLGDGLWWAIVTLTTVGFGDITPVTTVGRIIGSALMVGGMFTLALFAGIVGHSLLHAVLGIREEQFRMSGYVDHIILCGYETGANPLLQALRHEIDLEQNRVVVFANRERASDLPPEFLWVSGDPTKESELGKIRLTHARTVVVVGERSQTPQHADAATILTIFTIRAHLAKHAQTHSRRRPVHIVAEILDSENAAHARTAGADEVVETRQVGFSMLSHAVAYPGIADVTSHVIQSGWQNLYAGRMPDADASALSFGQVAQQIREQHGALVLGIRDPETGEERLNPSDATPIAPSAQVIYLADKPVLPAP